MSLSCCGVLLAPRRAAAAASWLNVACKHEEAMNHQDTEALYRCDHKRRWAAAGGTRVLLLTRSCCARSPNAAPASTKRSFAFSTFCMQRAP